MICDIIEEKLVVTPNNHTELYAIQTWLKKHPSTDLEVDLSDADEF